MAVSPVSRHTRCYSDMLWRTQISTCPVLCRASQTHSRQKKQIVKLGYIYLNVLMSFKVPFWQNMFIVYFVHLDNEWCFLCKTWNNAKFKSPVTSHVSCLMCQYWVGGFELDIVLRLARVWEVPAPETDTNWIIEQHATIVSECLICIRRSPFLLN